MILLKAFLALALLQFPSLPGPGPVKYTAPASNNYTMVQHKLTDCAAGTSCTAAIAASGSGHAIVILTDNFQNSQINISSVTDNAGSSYTVPTGCVAYIGSSGAAGGAYSLNSASGATSVTVNWSGSVQAGAIEVIEASSTSAPQFDQCVPATGNASTDNPPGVSLTLSSSSEYVFQSVVPDSGCTAITAPYTSPADFDTGNTGSGFAGSINTSSGSAPTWTCSSHIAFAEIGLALK